jgi:hypothetical protein
MRLSVDSLRRVVKRDLTIEFVPQQLTSYGGLELLRRYVQRLDLVARLRQACAAPGGDYRGSSLCLLILALLYAGGRRLEHLRYLAGDALITRFCGLAQVPSLRTVSHWLQRFTQERLQPLVQSNQDVVLDTVARLKLPRLTIDLDGTVVRTGATVACAFRGFNPHHRKDPSYYPLLAHLAQTGHILRAKNRPGNVHDSRGEVTSRPSTRAPPPRVPPPPALQAPPPHAGSPPEPQARQAVSGRAAPSPWRARRACRRSTRRMRARPPARRPRARRSRR